MSCGGGHAEQQEFGCRGVQLAYEVAGNEDDFRPDSAQRDRLKRTLNYVPIDHLRKFSIRNGYIRAAGRRCPPQRGGGSDSAPWIRLSAVSFGASYNRNLNVTLLHEFGHVVDYMYNAMAALRQRHQDLYNLLARTRHEGGTQGPGESFADCYMVFVITQLAGQPYTHRADPEAYRGQEATRRFEALINSPAFDTWTGQLSNLRRRQA